MPSARPQLFVQPGIGFMRFMLSGQAGFVALPGLLHDDLQ